MIDLHLIRHFPPNTYTSPAFATRPVPLPWNDADWIARPLPRLRAAEIILAHDAERLSLVLAAARAVKPTLGRDLAARLDVGGDHLIELADVLAEAARRLRIIEVAAEHAARDSIRGPSSHRSTATPKV